MGTWWQDLKYAFRVLIHAPGHAVVAVLTLALGIGTSTAVFSGVNALWFNPVPAAQPERLVQIRTYRKEANDYASGVSAAIVQELRADPRHFVDLTRISNTQLLWENDGWIGSVDGAAVSPNFFSFWSVRPRLGRTFAPDEGHPGASPVIVLSHKFWKTKLGGDPSWMGKALAVQGQQRTVIGVMPPHFRFPFYADFWVPADDPQTESTDKDKMGYRFGPAYTVIARLAPGVLTTQAQATLDVLSQRYEDDHRKYGYGYTSLRLQPVREMFASADVQKTIPGFVGAMIFVLVIACANVANLNLVRTEARQHELAVRGALGMGRLQLLRQLLLESLLPALAGAAVGIGLTYWSFGLMERLLSPWLPRLRGIQLDKQVLTYSLLATVGAGLVSGIVPAWYGSTRSPADVLKQSGAQATPGIFRNLYRRGLVVLEVSLAMALLAGAGLMIQSVAHLLRSNPGYEPTNLISISIAPGLAKKYQTLEAKNQLMAEVHRRLLAVPGVEAVGILVEAFGAQDFAIMGRKEPMPLRWAGCGIGIADAFKAMKAPLLRGRYFDERDQSADATTIVVNETLAQRCWPGENVVGKTVRAPTGDKLSYEVVGVVGDTRIRDLTHPPAATLYLPQQIGFTPLAHRLLVRTKSEPSGLIKPLLAEIKAAAPELREPSVEVLLNALYDSTRGHRTYMCYLLVFGAVGLLLAGVGVYAVLAYSVAVREREIGIRMALGAAESGVVRMVLRQGMVLVATGITLGLGAAWALTRFLRGMLYGVNPMDPLALAASAVVLAVIALLGCYLPARRAARIDPMVALRCE